MTFRVPTNRFGAEFTTHINSQRSRLGVLQERLASGKRINRFSDDPNGAEAILNLRTSLQEIAQFGRNTEAAFQKLSATDTALNTYENTLDRVKSLISQGLNGTISQTAKDALATELETLRERFLNLANSKYNGEYLFGGTRQTEPPFDPQTAAQSTLPTDLQYVQIEPGANAIAVGITAELVFAEGGTDIFTDLDAAITALRGTGDETVDAANLQNAFNRFEVYSDQSVRIHSFVGANQNTTELVQERLTSDELSFQQRISTIEDADFARTATEYTEAQNALDATLQVAARGQRSLIDFLG